jgi:hypothetical protein
MKIRFTNNALLVSGVFFAILSFFNDSLFPSFMFGCCFGFTILNLMDDYKSTRIES